MSGITETSFTFWKTSADALNLFLLVFFAFQLDIIDVNMRKITVMVELGLSFLGHVPHVLVQLLVHLLFLL